ncbi:MAG: outer membrane protein assembly factor BamE [Verrucomicrobiota bacterium]|nr:outer membrane protein assembly factor BamE [Verrucomicrobiota bacterium]
MKTIRTVMAVAGVFLIAGCATTFKPWKLSEVNEGMERDQVVKILGAPDYAVNKDGAEYIYYTYREELAPMSDVSLETEAGLERRVEEFNRTLKEGKYEVKLVEGKVVTHKELEN